MKKFFRKIHLWLSVPFGIIITLTCFSGAMLVFEKEITELCRHDLYYVDQVKETTLPIDQLAAQVAMTLPDDVSVTGITISSDPKRTYQVNLSKPRRSSVYADPYTGEIKGKYERLPFFATMFKLHRWLLDSMKPDGGICAGKLIVGISTLVFVIVLISGIVIWWPRTGKALKKSLQIPVRQGWKRFWYGLHIAGGMYALIFLLAMALTGLTWSFSWYRTGFYKVFGVETQQEMSHNAPSSPSVEKGNNAFANEHKRPEKAMSSPNEERGRNRGEGERPGRERGDHRDRNGERHDHDRRPQPFAHWQKVVDVLKSQNPEYRQISVSENAATVSFGSFGNQRASDRYSFNPRNGEITEVAYYKEAERSNKIRGWIFSVHVGSWGGIITRILAFLSALLGASLPLTGYYFWIKKLMKRKNK